MNLTILTLPIRSSGDTYIPIGAIHVAQSAKNAGHNVNILNQDYYRYDDNEFIEQIKQKAPDVVGISAVVSTSYKAVKHYSSLIKKKIPNITIILGGAASVSAEPILRFSNVDIVVVGEGEDTITDLLSKFDKSKNKFPVEFIDELSGIAFIKDNEFKFNGFRKQIFPLDKIPMPDFSFLDDHFSHFLLDPLKCGYFSDDHRTYESKRFNQKALYIKSSRGCINRCTFCHRYEKGWRSHSVDYLINLIKHIKEKYSVGFFIMADECFGCNKKWVHEFIEKVKSLDVLWACGGMRAKDISNKLCDTYKNAGCTAIVYGFESGSEKMLNVMEKNITVSDNMRAAKITLQKKLFTTFQIIIGMPGESTKTIAETIEFLKKAFDDWNNLNFQISVNYVQALPGTPIYAYMKYKNIIENSINGDDHYLEYISDTDAASEKNLNFTTYPDYEFKMWKYKIISEVRKDFYSKRNIKAPVLDVLKNYFKRHSEKNTLTTEMKYNNKFESLYLLKVFLKIVSLDFKISGFKSFLINSFDYITYKIFGRLAKKELEYNEYMSLREYMRQKDFVKTEDKEVKKLIEGN